MEHVREKMVELVKKEAERSLTDKKERLDKQYRRIKEETRSNYDRLVGEFKSKII